MVTIDEPGRRDVTKNGIPHNEIYEAVKNVDLRKVLTDLGYDIGLNGFFVENPIRQERKSSIHIRKDNPARWHDFGGAANRKDGDLIDFLMYAKDMTHNQARDEAARILGLRPGMKRPAPRNTEATAAPPQNPLLGEAALERLVVAATAALAGGTTQAARQARAYLRGRALNPDGEAVRYARVGVIDDSVLATERHLDRRLGGNLMLPYTGPDGVVRSFNTRATSDVDGNNYLRQARAKKAGAFNGASVPRASTVIVVEGELDALSVMEAMGPTTAVIATGGGGITSNHAELLTDAKRVCLLFDDDPAGEEFTRHGLEYLKNLGIQAIALRNMADTIDPNDALVRFGPSALQEWLGEQLPRAELRGDQSYLRTTFLENLRRARSRSSGPFPSGIRELDKLLDGGYRQGLHVIGGLTGIGKTSLVQSIALTNARQGRNVVFQSLEQSQDELWSRIVAADLGLPIAAFRDGHFAVGYSDKRALEHVIQQHEKWPALLRAAGNLRILEAGLASASNGRGPEISQLVAAAKQVIDEVGAPPLVVVDYIQRMSAQGGVPQDARQRVGHNVGALQAELVRNLGCTVIAISSISRAFYAPSGSNYRKEDLLASLKESGDLEFTAYTVAILQTSEPGARRPAPRGGGRLHGDQNEVTISLLKNREGRIGSITVPWHPLSNSWASEHEPDPMP